MYKALVRSVLDYACVTSIACNKEVVSALEVIQNDALRVIYKKTVMDHVKVEDLRTWAGVETIKTRHENLLTRFYERALISGNPLIAIMFEKYNKFKRRDFLNPELAVRADNSVDLEKLDFIRNHNENLLKKREKHCTTLCGANSIIKDFVLDDHVVGGSGVS